MDKLELEAEWAYEWRTGEPLIELDDDTDGLFDGELEGSVG